MSIYKKYADLASFDFVENYDLENSYTASDPEGVILDLDVAVALIRTDGHVSNVARHLNRSRRVIDTYIQRNSDLSELMDDLYESFIDDTEDKTKALARAGDPATLRYVLGTRGKNRGYVTRVEATGKDGADLNVQFFLPVNGREPNEMGEEDGNAGD